MSRPAPPGEPSPPGDPPSSRYVEQTPGKYVGDTRCNKLPVRVCGAGCVVEEGPEECHDKQIDSLVDVPEESCDLNPQKNCRLITRLIPSLEPKRECTTVPKEVCHMKFTSPQYQTKPLRTEWCLESEGSTFQGAQATYQTPGQANTRQQVTYQAPTDTYGATDISSDPDLASYTAGLLEQLRRLRRQMQAGQ